VKAPTDSGTPPRDPAWIGSPSISEAPEMRVARSPITGTLNVWVSSTGYLCPDETDDLARTSPNVLAPRHARAADRPRGPRRVEPYRRVMSSTAQAPAVSRPLGPLPSVAFSFADTPPGWPNVNTRGSTILTRAGKPPQRIDVALHRDARGIYRILTDGEQVQPSLWLTVPYALTGDHDRRGGVVYEVCEAYALAWDGSLA
jgi:hypothetical protein